MRTIRLDDYPSGCPGFDIQESRAVVQKVLAIFNKYQVPYIFGVSPILMSGYDIAFLQDVVGPTGKVVQHGFNHAMGFRPWENITDIWPKGGEFWDMSKEQICMAWTWCDRFLSLVPSYDPHSFIAPFNCWNQNALDALHQCGVKTLHGCDKEWDAYNLGVLDYHGMETVLARFQILYHDAHKVLEYLEQNPEEKSQLTLHWMFDKNRQGWEMDYENLCRWIAANG